MSRNIEIKAYYSDLEKGKRLAEQINAKFLGRDHQLDTFFKVPKGRLKLRESSLSGNFLIPYLRPDQKKAKDSRYVLLPVKDAPSTKKLLDDMLGITLTVEKNRLIYLYENVRIHLDEVRQLGNFIEFEAVMDRKQTEEESRERLNKLMAYFGITESELVSDAYADLLARRIAN